MMFDTDYPKNAADFIKQTFDLLISERGLKKEEAEALIKKYEDELILMHTLRDEIDLAADVLMSVRLSGRSIF